jgi:hypothetical protein
VTIIHQQRKPSQNAASIIVFCTATVALILPSVNRNNLWRLPAREEIEFF